MQQFTIFEDGVSVSCSQAEQAGRGFRIKAEVGVEASSKEDGCKMILVFETLICFATAVEEDEDPTTPKKEKRFTGIGEFGVVEEILAVTLLMIIVLKGFFVEINATACFTDDGFKADLPPRQV